MSKGENIVHYGGIRLRVVGNGNILPTFYSLENFSSQALVAVPMLATTDRQLTRLANFQTQRASLELKTEVAGEHFHINRIIIYAKEVFTEFPSVQ